MKHDDDVNKMGNGLLSSFRVSIVESLRLDEFCGDDADEQEELVNELVGDGLDFAGEGMHDDDDDESTLGLSNMGKSFESV